jgi:sugar-specific transcriptional regulator TrmB
MTPKEALKHLNIPRSTFYSILRKMKKEGLLKE